MDFDAHHYPGNCITKGNCKDCEKTFALYCIPSVLKNEEKNKLSIMALKRKKIRTKQPKCLKK